MIHARSDYNRIQDPAGLIPEDEPVFLLRAQDRFAADAVAYYAELVAMGSDGDSEEECRALWVARLSREQAKRMHEWPKKKYPDAPTSNSPDQSK